MKKAALYVHGRVVVGSNHGDAFGKLTEEEKNAALISGFYDCETEEFDGEEERDHFFDKDILLIRHASVDVSESPDPNLASQGVQQAEQIARLLQQFDLSERICIASPFLRCLQTAHILQQILDMDFLADPLLAETPDFLEESENFSLKNRRSSYPQFSWSSEDEFQLRRESQKVFLERTLFVLRNLPHRSIIVTHYGLICNMARLALCEEKAQVVIRRGVPPASITHIHQQEVETLDKHHEKIKNRSEIPHRKTE